MSHSHRVRIRLSSTITIVVEGTVDEVLEKVNSDKYVSFTCLSDGQRELFVNTDKISIVEAV